MYFLNQTRFAFLLLAFLALITTNVTANNGQNYVEDTIYNFNLGVEVSEFNSLITQFENQLGGNTNAQIGGFVFIPYWLNQAGNEVLKPSTHYPGGNLVPEASAGLSVPTGFTTSGFRVYLTYYYFDGNNRKIGVLGFDPTTFTEPYEVFETIKAGGTASCPTGSCFLIQEPVSSGFNVVDYNEIKDITEMELSYLSIDDYFYVAKEDSYYSVVPSPRKIIIQRALVSQTFEPGSEGPGDIKRYRTLTFRPSDLGSGNANEEAVMAFKIGYYCPPDWQDNPGQLTGGGSANGSAQSFQSREGKSLDDPQGTTAIISPPEEVLRVLNLFLDDQLSKRERVFKDFAKEYPSYFTPTIKDVFQSIWSWLLLLFCIAVGYLIGRRQPE